MGQHAIAGGALSLTDGSGGVYRNPHTMDQRINLKVCISERARDGSHNRR